MEIHLKDKVAIVTGVGAGIGREIAMTFGREGVKTVGVDMDADRLADLGRAFDAEGFDGMQLACDVREPDQIRAVVDKAAERYGRIDILVNNAGVAKGGPVETLPVEVWDLNHASTPEGRFSCARRSSCT